MIIPSNVNVFWKFVYECFRIHNLIIHNLISIFFYLISEISYLTSERISKQVWKSPSYSFQEHLLCHWDSNKGRIFFPFMFVFFLYFCNYVLINFCFLYKWSLLFLCSSFHWIVFVVFHLFESHTLFSWR